MGRAAAPTWKTATAAAVAAAAKAMATWKTATVAAAAVARTPKTATVLKSFSSPYLLFTSLYLSTFTPLPLLQSSPTTPPSYFFTVAPFTSPYLPLTLTLTFTFTPHGLTCHVVRANDERDGTGFHLLLLLNIFKK